MSRLLVNPNTPQAWEIQFKPGEYSLGRGEANDFQIRDPSVSTSHCRVAVTEDSVVINDLGSTNGTFVNRAPVQRAKLEDGQAVRLGGVEMIFYTDAPSTPATAPSAARMRPAGLRISGAAHAAPAETSSAAPPLAPPILEIPAGPRFCKFHPRSPARFLCNKCNRTFCHLCVATRNAGGNTIKTCRSCGVECVPLEVAMERSSQRSFYASVPGAFIYPFRGMGLLILICATLAFAGLGFVSAGLFSIFAKIVFYGFLFLFMQNIIHSTASDENEALSFPEASGLFGAAFQLGGTILMSFGLAIALLAAKFYGIEIPGGAIIAATILGCLYFPMAFLAVAMKDSVLAGNPLVVIPSIMKIPLQYLVAAVLLVAVYGVRQLGGLISGVAGSVSFTTRDMSVLFLALGLQAVWAFVSVYLLTVNMRILGLLYNSTKDELGWF